MNQVIAQIVYVLCSLTSIACAALLWRSYMRTRQRLLLWTGIFFIAIAGNSVTLVVDLMIVPGVDLSALRICMALVGFCFLLYGLIWEDES